MDSICKEGEVLQGSREEGKLVTKEGNVMGTKEASRTMVLRTMATRAMDIIRAMVLAATIIINSSSSSVPMKKEEEAKESMYLNGGRACTAWPNTGRLVA